MQRISESCRLMQFLIGINLGDIVEVVKNQNDKEPFLGALHKAGLK